MRNPALRAFWVLLAVAANLTAADETQDRALGILRDHCLACHSKAAGMSGLDLSTRESALKGGQRGPAIVQQGGREPSVSGSAPNDAIGDATKQIPCGG